MDTTREYRVDMRRPGGDWRPAYGPDANREAAVRAMRNLLQEFNYSEFRMQTRLMTPWSDEDRS